MTQNISSIEDLFDSEQAIKDENSPEAKFISKQKEIIIKNLEKLAAEKAANLGYSYINLVGFPISSEALSLIEESESQHLKTVCFFYDGEHIRLGTVEPTKEIEELLQKLCKKYFCKGAIYIITERSFNKAFDLYKMIPKIKRVEGGIEINPEDLKKFEEEINDYRALEQKINEVNMSEVVTLLIAAALKTNASDIHIEAEETRVTVRLRIDGVLQEAAHIEKKKWPKIISRMKLLSKVKINITDKPQDGRFSIFMPDEKIAVRSSFLPTAHGESVTMRLLKSKSVALAFEDLGLRSGVFEILEREIKKPNGLILSAGPTGSGKTTTLYAILNRLNKPGTKIITLEDPIEYELKGINQSQVDVSKGYTFAKGLKSLLRQDPDIVMVGEIRDLETAEIAVQASLTGHLVLSTLHTNDASGVIPRLVDMGVKPYFLSPSINCVIGQRLVRRLCDNCKISYELVGEEAEKVKKILAVVSPKSGVTIPPILPQVYRVGPGCDYCAGVGYKGRIGIYEVFTMSNEIKKLTSEEAPAFKILEQAIEEGMLTMLQDGILKVFEGITDLEEIYRVIGKFDYIDTLYDIIVSKTISRGLTLNDKQINSGIELAKNFRLAASTLNKMAATEIINTIMSIAIAARAGDVHIDPINTGVKIRLRIDGILNDLAEIDKDHYIPLISVIKSLSGFATNVKKTAYDGRFGISINKQKIDCRVSIISGGYGETAVIRILKEEESLQLENLGIGQHSFNNLLKSISKTKGIIVAAGPTGSGKTTTLYAILNKINNPDVKIITIEDPIEYRIDGAMQTQINPEEGYTFAVALKSLLRQNPNIIMVGEIRDSETARVAIEAAMTGHLVFSTIHANSAAGAISRFSVLGIDRHTLANALECAIGQRLVRKICPHCKKEDILNDSKLKEVEDIINSMHSDIKTHLKKPFKFYIGTGCDYCSQIGYKGRIGIYEIFSSNQSLVKIIQSYEAGNYEIEEVAVANGAVTMLQDGILKALAGETSLDEVFRVSK